jgi:MFS family permease
VKSKPSYSNNIYSLYLIKLSKWLMLIMPVVALFYADNGLNDYDIFLLQAIYSLSVALLEIPSGYMADIIGRKKSLLLGSILGTAGFVIYSLSSSFYGFLCAEIVLGFGGSFISGSDSALLYDSLQAMKKEQRYLQYEGRITSLGNFAETFAAICGGLVAAALSYRAVYVTQAVIAAIAIPAAFMILEPPRKKLERPGISQIFEICRYALWQNKGLSSILLFSSVIGTATLCMAWTSQVYFVRNGLTEISITPLWVVLNLTVAVISAYAATVVKQLGSRTALFIIVMCIPGGFVALGFVSLPVGIVVLLLFYGVRGYATPYLRDELNQRCVSETRATVLSIRSMVIRVSFSAVGPVMGFVSNTYTLSVALILAGIIFSVGSLTGLIFVLKNAD